VRRRGQGTLPDLEWFTPEGAEMTEEDWDSGFGRAIAVYLNGQGIAGTDGRGQRVVDDSFLLWFSAHHEPIDFRLPGAEYGPGWEIVLDTMDVNSAEDSDGKVVEPDGVISVGPRALVVLRGVS